MTISELIDVLQSAQAEHGDVQVVVTDGCGCCEWLADPAPKFDEVDEYDEQSLRSPLPVGASAFRLN